LKIIDLTHHKKQSFSRKVAVVAYYLEQNELSTVPHFLFTVIAPKQSLKVVKDWDSAKSYRMPSGFSIIKGTSEMLRHGEIVDISPGYKNYFNTKISTEDIVYPMVTALNESAEEGGVKVKNIHLIFDLGFKKTRLDGRDINVRHFAIELKKPKNGKAIDSLAIKYFTLREIKLAIKQRNLFNIPLMRPSHGKFVEQTFRKLKKYYANKGVKLERKGPSKKKEKLHIKNINEHFLSLINNAQKGIFKSHKYTVEETVKNIIFKSIRSHNKTVNL